MGCMMQHIIYVLLLCASTIHSAPTASPTGQPTLQPTYHPTVAPVKPTNNPTTTPSTGPTFAPSNNPSIAPTNNPSIAPTNNPSAAPTNNPSAAPTNNPTIAPTNNPTMTPSTDPTIAPTKNPTMTPSADPTITPTGDPTIAPTNDPTVDPTIVPTNNPTPSPSFGTMCTECTDDAANWMQIKVIFSFAEYVTYDLQEIECFIHQIFVEWLDIDGLLHSFEPCDVHTLYIGGGKENEQTCEQPPCFTHSSEWNRRLLQIDGNTTMTLISKNAEITEALESVSLESGEQIFEMQYLLHYSLAMTVHIEVEQQNAINNPLNGLHPLWHIAIAVCVLICCVGCFLLYRFIQNMDAAKVTNTESPKEENREQITETGNVMKKASVSSTVDYGGGGQEFDKLTAVEEEKPAIKRRASDSLELMTVNQIHRSVTPQRAQRILSDEPEAFNKFNPNAQSALNMIIDAEPKRDPPSHALHNMRSYDAIATAQPNPPPLTNAPWSAPAPNGTFPAGFLPPPQSANPPEAIANNATPYNDNPFNQYLPQELAEFYNSQYNTGGADYPIATVPIAMDPKQQNAQGVDEDDTSGEDYSSGDNTDDTGDDVNAALVSNQGQSPPAEPRIGSVEESASAMTTGSSWKTTHELSTRYSEYTMTSTRCDPYLDMRKATDLVRKINKKRKDRKETEKKDDAEQEQVIMDDKLKKMIVSATPIDDDHGILDNASKLLEFEDVESLATDMENTEKPQSGDMVNNVIDCE